jgi:hypothetical protein
MTATRTKKAAKAKAASKPAKKAKVTKAPAPERKKLSALGAAAKVLVETGRAMTTRELVEAMAARGYWTSPAGKTPHATLYAAILRELAAKGDAARFAKTGPGMFAAACTAARSPGAAATPETSTPRKKATKGAPKSMTPGGTPGPESVSELFRT